MERKRPRGCFPNFVLEVEHNHSVRSLLRMAETTVQCGSESLCFFLSTCLHLIYPASCHQLATEWTYSIHVDSSRRHSLQCAVRCFDVVDCESYPCSTRL